jgi:hypothetical protein
MYARYSTVFSVLSLFIDCLAILSVPVDSVKLNDSSINDYRIGKDVKEFGRGLLQSNILEFT